MDNLTHTDGETTIRAVSEENRFAYHRIEIEAQHSYEIDIWTDGAPQRPGPSDRLSQPSRSGYDLDITSTADKDDERIRIGTGRSSRTSHYGDLQKMDTELLEEAADEITSYLEQAGEPGTVHKSFGSFIDDVQNGYLDH